MHKITSKTILIRHGCTKSCSYCTFDKQYIQDESIENILTLVGNDCDIVQLSGINMNEYEKLFELIDTITKTNVRVINIDHIIPSTKHSYQLLNTVLQNSKMSKYINLPLQSGCNETLKRMNVGHTIEEAITYIRPEFDYTINVIVGFPGETDEEFEETFEFLKKLKQINNNIIYAVKEYIPYKKSKSYHLPNQINNEIKRQRYLRIKTSELGRMPEPRYDYVFPACLQTSISFDPWYPNVGPKKWGDK